MTSGMIAASVWTVWASAAMMQYCDSDSPCSQRSIQMIFINNSIKCQGPTRIRCLNKPIPQPAKTPQIKSMNPNGQYLNYSHSCNDYLQMKKNQQGLKLSYEQYRKAGKSIANTRIDKYIVYNEIGRGAFGQVYKGMDDQTKRMVAIKVLDLRAVQLQPNQKVRQIRRRLCKTQSQLMMLCQSQHVVRCYDVYKNDSLKIMIIEFCNGGMLQQQIDKKVRIPQKQAIMIIKQIINGLAELHRNKIIHRDLKAENILSHNGVYKIADMGFSKQVQGDQIKQTTLGTITTMAPEVMNRQPYGLKADIWSIGIIFFQMIFGQPPYRSTNAQLMYREIQQKKILQTQRLTIGGVTASEQVTQFLKQVLVVQSKNRLGWKQLSSHPLFRSSTQHHLTNQFRISLDLNIPKGMQEEQQEMTIQNLIYKFQQSSVQKPQKELIRLTNVQAQQKFAQVNTHQDAIFQWTKQTYHECKKTEIIFREIVSKIQQHKLLNLQQRDVIQLMYLLSTRCKNNISIINDRLRREKQESQKYKTGSLEKLFQTVKPLYDQIQAIWKKYCNLLTQTQNKVSNIISDRFTRIFNKKSIQEKDQFLVGIENIEYTKQQQIQFTNKMYINELLKSIIKSPEGRKVQNYLSHYLQINAINPTDLQNRNLEEYVRIILQ